MSFAFVLALALAPPSFTTVDEGLEIVELAWPTKSSHADSKLYVARVDPEKRELALLMRSELGGATQTTRAWARAHKLKLAVNAGMFQVDGKTASHLMISGKHVNNGALRADNAVLAFGRKDAGVPRAQIIDREHQDFDKLRARYTTLIQGIRMVDKKGANKWSKQPKKWSTVAAAVDDKGRVLFLFSRSPYRVHDFVNMALSMKLGIVNMMYLEGGPEASLYVEGRWDRFGSYETGFYERDDNRSAWPIPNVIGVR
jgi:uncharacterized protein YigE (DUF2233 family)